MTLMGRCQKDHSAFLIHQVNETDLEDKHSRAGNLTVMSSVTPEVLAAKAVTTSTTAFATSKGGCTSSHALQPAWHLLIGLLHQAQSMLTTERGR